MMFDVLKVLSFDAKFLATFIWLNLIKEKLTDSKDFHFCSVSHARASKYELTAISKDFFATSYMYVSSYFIPFPRLLYMYCDIYLWQIFYINMYMVLENIVLYWEQITILHAR